MALSTTLARTVLVSCLFLWTFTLLYITSHQLILLIRRLPFLQLFTAALIDLLIALGFTRTPGITLSSLTVRNVLKGVAVGISHTFWQWSLFKLPPASGISLHLVALPLITGLKDGRAVRAGTLVVVFCLGLVVDRATPLDPYAFGKAFIALTLTLLVEFYSSSPSSHSSSSYIPLPTSGASSSPPPFEAETLPSILALLTSFTLHRTLGPSLFGREAAWDPMPGHRTHPPLLHLGVIFYGIYFLALRYTQLSNSPSKSVWPREWYALPVLAAVLLSSGVKGMGERIRGFDAFLFLVVVGAIVRDWRKDGGEKETGVERDIPGALFCLLSFVERYNG